MSNNAFASTQGGVARSLVPALNEPYVAADLQPVNLGNMGELYDSLMALGNAAQAGSEYSLSSAGGSGQQQVSKAAGSTTLNGPDGLKYSTPVENALNYAGRGLFYEGGEAQCTAFVKQTTNAGVSASSYIRGSHITPENAADIPIGAPIGIFGENGQYLNLRGQSHVGLWGGVAENGFYIVHQYIGIKDRIIQKEFVDWNQRNIPLLGMPITPFCIRVKILSKGKL